MSRFAQDVKIGLTRYPKAISSKYFYDKRGDKIFEQIMAMPEYYLTRSEHWIFNHRDIASSLMAQNKKLEVYELGAGNGYKTKVLLSKIMDHGIEINYYPIDISPHVLELCKENIQKDLPNLNITPIQNEYFDALQDVKSRSEYSKLILFLGSNLGNFLPEAAQQFMLQLSNALNAGDQILLGLDLKKDPTTILEAYNDHAGITASFNLNLLQRINLELDGNFDLSEWKHAPVYDPGSGTTKSYLMSLKEQSVKIKAINQSIDFKRWETIHTEISQKYDDKMVSELAAASKLQLDHTFTDINRYCANYLLTKT